MRMKLKCRKAIVVIPLEMDKVTIPDKNCSLFILTRNIIRKDYADWIQRGLDKNVMYENFSAFGLSLHEKKVFIILCHALYTN